MTDENRQQHFRRLLSEAEGGSEEAARELYETYVQHVLRCVRHRMWRKLRTRFDSQDFVQQVWASFFDDMDRLPDFQTPEDLTNYLMAMARNKVMMAGRQGQSLKRDVERETRVDEESEMVGPHPAGRDPTPSAVAVYREEYDRLIDQQPPDVREIAELRMEGSTFEEIAEELELDESWARRLMRRLRSEAGEENGERGARSSERGR
jgi:RNA polymerase sigma-70 factor (ECF subfamily)